MFFVCYAGVGLLPYLPTLMDKLFVALTAAKVCTELYWYSTPEFNNLRTQYCTFCMATLDACIGYIVVHSVNVLFIRALYSVGKLLDLVGKQLHLLNKHFIQCTDRNAYRNKAYNYHSVHCLYFLSYSVEHPHSGAGH